MPNHTANNFTITGPKDTVLAFIERAKETNPDELEPKRLSFNSFIPMPSELKYQIRPTRIQWCLANWGTDRNCYSEGAWNINEHRDHTSATICYETAWRPVTVLWQTVSQEYPECEFFHEYADEGGEFLGSETIVDGEITDTEEFEWDSDDGITLREALGRYTEEDAAQAWMNLE